MYLEINNELYLTLASENELERCIDIIIEVSEGLLGAVFSNFDVKSALLLTAANEDPLFNLQHMYVIKRRACSQGTTVADVNDLRCGNEKIKDFDEIAGLLFAYKVKAHRLPEILGSLISADNLKLLASVILPDGRDCNHDLLRKSKAASERRATSGMRSVDSDCFLEKESGLCANENTVSRGDGSVFCLNTLFVSPDSRRHGLGRFLIEFSKIIGERSGCSELCLHCYSDNKEALSLYAKNGLKPIRAISYDSLVDFPHKQGVILSCLLDNDTFVNDDSHPNHQEGESSCQ